MSGDGLTIAFTGGPLDGLEVALAALGLVAAPRQRVGIEETA